MLDSDDKGYIIVSVLERIPIGKLGGHWKFIKNTGQFCTYIRLKGSSEMDSKEMSTLINGIVSECKELGIETITPNDIERMVQQWGVKRKNDTTP